MKTFVSLIILLVISVNAFANPWPPEEGAGGVVYVGAGGDYEIAPGGTVTLSGGYIPSVPSPSIDYVWWSWSVDTVNVGSDSSWGNPGWGIAIDCQSQPLSYDYLVTDLGLAPGQHTVKLDVAVGWHYADFQYSMDPTLEMGQHDSAGSDTVTLAITPEPATLLLLGLGGLGLLRRKRSKA
jgi:hypothetical protein